MTAPRRPTKAEAKRARAEAARVAAARAERRARTMRIGLWSAGAVAVVVLVVIAAVLLLGSDDEPDSSAGPTPPATSSAAPSSTASSGATPSAAAAPGRTTNPPWAAPADASAAVAAAGLPMLGEEGNALHIHAHLDVIADGRPVQVPADIGVDEARQKISPLHSHDTTGVIHIESPDPNASFTLGQFFTEWQVSLATDHIGGLVADGTRHLVVYVNGKVRTGDPAALVLAAHDEIAIVYGTDAQQTNVPSSYQWTNGL